MPWKESLCDLTAWAYAFPVLLSASLRSTKLESERRKRGKIRRAVNDADRITEKHRECCQVFNLTQ